MSDIALMHLQKFRSSPQVNGAYPNSGLEGSDVEMGGTF